MKIRKFVERAMNTQNIVMSELPRLSWVVHEELGDWYDLETGFKHNLITGEKTKDWDHRTCPWFWKTNLQEKQD